MRVSCTKRFGRVVQSESKLSRSSYFRHKLVGLIINFFLFGLWAVTSQTRQRKLMARLPKLPSTVSEIFKEEKHSHQKNFLLSVSEFELMIYGIRQETSECHQICFLRVRSNILPKSCVGKKSSTFLHFQQKTSRIFGEKLLTWLSNLPPTCSQGSFAGRKIGEKNCFKSFFDFGKEIFKLLHKSS